MTEHIHDKPLSPYTAPLFEGEPGFPQNQSPPVPTPHNEVNVVRGMQRSRMGISRSRSGFSREYQSGTRSFSCYFLYPSLKSETYGQVKWIRVLFNTYRASAYWSMGKVVRRWLL